MQPPGSLQLHPGGPAPAPALESIAGGFQKLGEKQLFEKFWKGTFKAVATPRPGSVIVASITARRRAAESETTACQPLKTDDGESADTWAASRPRSGCVKKSRRKRHSHHHHHRTRNPSFDELLSPRKGKKKKRKSERRRRKRNRSPSHSLSPLRKKKKKKKKSAKKSKRHRCTSKKSKHSSSSLKHKRRDERKHKKSSRTHRRRRRRDRRLRSDNSSCRSKTEDRYPLQKSVVHMAFRDLAAVEEETRAALRHTDARPTTKSVCTAAPKCRSVLSACAILPSNPGKVLFNGSGAQDCRDGPHDYDSGNDTSSPPSSKTGVSQASAAEYARTGRVASAFRDSASDSGNSVTSFASSCKPFGENSLSAPLCNQISNREQITLGCHVEVVGSSAITSCESRRRSSSQTKGRSSSSRSRSSGSSRYLGRYSRSSSLSSRSSYSRSPSHSDVRRKGSKSSLSSRGSYSRHSADRLRDRKRRADSRETDAKHGRKVRKRGRRKSYTPMRKRRRDSPSHLEARRITSARKRPIPYFRPSPPSSSRSTSVSSWSSLFTRSRSPIHSISRSRSRSHSFSSYRSYSRSSSWNSTCGSRSRSRSRSLQNKRRKTRH